MVRDAWNHRFQTLADILRHDCARAAPEAVLEIQDRVREMLAAEEDPTVVPFYPIGTIYRFHVRERRKFLMFRWWKTVVSIGMEEMWGAPHWAEDHGFWCVVYDPRFTEAARACMEKFSRNERLRLDFAGTSKDP